MASEQHYSQGLETYRVPMTLYSENRAKVIDALLTVLSTKAKNNAERGIILLEGETRHDTDHEPIFRQESYFHYLFGCDLPDCFGLLSFTGVDFKTVLFVPTWGEEVATVCGESPDFVELSQELGVDEVLSVDSLAGWVEEEMGRLGTGANNGISNGDINGSAEQPTLYLLKGLNTDSGNFAQPSYYKGIEQLEKLKDDETLFKCIAECRVHKVR
jgi:Xaa-Pro dipeptidase